MKAFEVVWNEEAFVVIAESEFIAKLKAASFMKMVGIDMFPTDVVLREIEQEVA